jgi:hypothetical protein
MAAAEAEKKITITFPGHEAERVVSQTDITHMSTITFMMADLGEDFFTEESIPMERITPRQFDIVLDFARKFPNVEPTAEMGTKTWQTTPEEKEYVQNVSMTDAIDLVRVSHLVSYHLPHTLMFTSSIAQAGDVLDYKHAFSIGCLKIRDFMRAHNPREAAIWFGLINPDKPLHSKNPPPGEEALCEGELGSDALQHFVEFIDFKGEMTHIDAYHGGEV